MEATISDPENPSPRRKGRAGIVVVAIVLFLVIAIFVGRNFQHAEEQEEDPASTEQPG
jgi:hypothetical protein